MSVYLRGSTYWIDVCKPDGTRLRETAKTDDYDRAMAYHNRRVKEIAKGQMAPKMWEDATERWLQERTDKRSLDRDGSIIRWLAPHFGGKVFSMITDDDVREVVEKKRKETTASNANHYLKFIKSLFNRSVDWRWIDASPIRMKNFPTPKAKVRFLTPDELQRLLAELPHHLSVMAEFSVLTGLRMSNVLGLKWDRVDLGRKLLWIESSEYKNKRDHGIPLSDRAVEIIQAEQGNHKRYVFTYKGYPVQNANTAAWQKGLERAQIENFRWHDLRHTFASYHALNGTPLLTLKALGGWQTLEMVNRYAHLSAEGTRAYVGNSAPTKNPQ